MLARKEFLADLSWKSIVLQTQDLRVGQVNKSYIGLIQKNLIENSIQDCLPYILNGHSPCYYFSSLS